MRLTVNPHALQWTVVGFGIFVVFNLLQSLKYADRPAFMVITRSPALLLCIAIGSLQTMINYGIMGFTPSFLMKHYGLSPTATGLQFGLVATVMGIIGPLVAGPVSDRVQRHFPGVGRVYVTLFALGLSPLIAIWVYGAENPASFYARFVPYSLVLTGWLPPLYAVMFEQVLPRMRGITSSTYVIASTIFGLGIGPFVVGMIADANGGNLAAAILDINWVAPLIIVHAAHARATGGPRRVQHDSARPSRRGTYLVVFGRAHPSLSYAASPMSAASAQLPCRPKRMRMGMLIVAIGPLAICSASNNSRSLRCSSSRLQI